MHGSMNSKFTNSNLFYFYFLIWSLSRLLCCVGSGSNVKPAGFVLLVQACVLQSRDAYWLPTPFSCFPFTSPPVRHRVPSHFKSSLLRSSVPPLLPNLPFSTPPDSWVCITGKVIKLAASY